MSGGDLAVEENLRVLVADDHPMALAGIRASLEDNGFTVCAEATDAQSAVAMALEEKPDVCLLDVNMPGGGINAARQISDEVPETAVVMLTVSRDEDDFFEALRAGASGYILKDTEPDAVADGLRSVLSGQAPLSGVLAARLIEEFRGREKKRLRSRGRSLNLTPKEWEVLRLMRKELSTEEIAKSLFVAPVTVRGHISTILKKLQVPDRSSAVRYLDEHP